jgi:hypothetical protein
VPAVDVVQDQMTRTRFAVDLPASEATDAVKRVLESHDEIRGFTSDGPDIHAKTGPKGVGEGYEVNVDVFDHDDGRTRILVDTSPLTKIYGGGGKKRDYSDRFHERITDAIADGLKDPSSITRTPERQAESPSDSSPGFWVSLTNLLTDDGRGREPTSGSSGTFEKEVTDASDLQYSQGTRFKLRGAFLGLLFLAFGFYSLTTSNADRAALATLGAVVTLLSLGLVVRNYYIETQ